MTTPYQSGATDPRLLASTALAKAKDVEARLINVIGGLAAVPPSITYTATQTIVTQGTNGSYSWTCPANVSQARIECWGAGAGGGGGSSARGGEGGGGGEYAAEPNYPLIPGTIYSYIVGNGGTGGTSGYGGQGGGDTIFDTAGIGKPTGVFANGGVAGGGFVGGAGGGSGGSGNTPSPNSWESPGGNGGGNGSQGLGGCGGGGVPNSLGGCTNGSNSGTSAGAAPGGGYAANGGAGGTAPGNGYAGGSPGGGGGGAGAAGGSTSGQLVYRLSGSATFYGSDATGGNANGLRGSGTMWQGGESASGGSYNGTMKSIGIIGGNPQSDLSGKSIDQVYIRLEQLHCWYNSGAYVILGYTPYTTWGSSWGGGGITAVKTWWQGPAVDQGGGPVTTDLTGAGLGNALASGAAKSISLGPGNSFNLYNYMSVWGAGTDNTQNPMITVNWHSGTAPAQAGAGGDGMVRITYSVSGVLQSALQSAAGTDPAGNAFGAGYTGPVQAVQPQSNPSVVETWHAMGAFGTNFSHGSPAPMYKLYPDNTVAFAGEVNIASGTTSGTIYTLPSSAYFPISLKKWTVPVSAGTPNTTAIVQITLNTSGQLILSSGPTGAAYSLGLDPIRYPLDY